MASSYPIRYPLIKVCGVTRLQDVDALAAAGVNAVGLNFVSRSPRCISIETARLLLERAAKYGMSRVAVVMDPSVEELTELLRELHFDYLQLHGCESPELLDQLDWSAIQVPLGIIKAVAWSGRSEEHELVVRWASAPISLQSPKLEAFLVDAYAPELGGGTGRIARWDLLMPRPSIFERYPLILAGGLVPDNVAKAIENVLPEGVDTASGVEASPGIKATEFVTQFGQRALEAFAVRYR